MDGVCCDTACGDGAADDCQACTAALTGGADGACAPASDGSSCDDGLVCNGSRVCAAGACGEATPPDCDDGNVCTADMCAEPDGCTSEPIEGCCTSDADCADTDDCTTDSCDLATGMCTNAPITGCPEPMVDAGTDAGGGASDDDGGCGCSIPGLPSSPSAPGLALTFLALLGWLRRR